MFLTLVFSLDDFSFERARSKALSLPIEFMLLSKIIVLVTDYLSLGFLILAEFVNSSFLLVVFGYILFVSF